MQHRRRDFARLAEAAKRNLSLELRDGVIVEAEFHAKLLAQWAKTDVLLMDDLAIALLADTARRDRLEVLDDRHGLRSTIITSQIPVESWHAAIGDPRLADAILDRLVHNAHRFTLSGESMRKRQNGLTNQEDSE